jgi:hypothetical protein
LKVIVSDFVGVSVDRLPRLDGPLLTSDMRILGSSANASTHCQQMGDSVEKERPLRRG